MLKLILVAAIKKLTKFNIALTRFVSAPLPGPVFLDRCLSGCLYWIIKGRKSGGGSGMPLKMVKQRMSGEFYGYDLFIFIWI